MQILEIILPVAVVVVAVVVFVVGGGGVVVADIQRRLCILVTMNSESQITKYAWYVYYLNCYFIIITYHTCIVKKC